MSRSGTYCGTIPALRGKTALLLDDPVTCSGGNFGLLIAQFDDLTLPYGYTHNWRTFDRKDFVEEVKTDVE